MTGLSIAIIGATSGIGRATALRLGQDGHRVLGVGRSLERAERLDRQLRRAGGAATSFDVAGRAGWDGAAAWIGSQTDRLDALINCAGVIIPQRHTSADGFELNFAAHHLAPFAITSRLLPTLCAGSVPHGPGGRALPRVVNVNSAGHQTSLGGHHNPVLDFSDLQSGRGYDPFLAYSRSKLANLLFTYELARRHGDRLATVALHPGVVRSDIGRHYPRARVAAMQIFAISPERAAKSITALTTGELPDNGLYYDQRQPVRSSPPSYDTAAASRLWKVTEDICGPFVGPVADSVGPGV